jgi:hypothetical protein
VQNTSESLLTMAVADTNAVLIYVDGNNPTNSFHQSRIQQILTRFRLELPRFSRQVRACARGNAPVLLFIANWAFIVQG